MFGARTEIKRHCVALTYYGEISAFSDTIKPRWMRLIGRISGNLAALGDDSLMYERRGWSAI